MTPELIRQVVRKALAEQGRLPMSEETLDDSDDLYRAGLSSHATVDLMLTLEDHFDIEFPGAMLERGIFESIKAITTAIGTLLHERQSTDAAR